MNKLFQKIAGIFFGATYGLILRFVFNVDAEGIFENSLNLFSFTFIWITPIIIGVIPFFFASKEQLDNWGYRIQTPIWSVIVFFLLCYLTRIEDLICLWILLLPYLIGAIIIGLIAGKIIKYIKDKKGIVYSIVLIPFIASPIEQQFQTPVNAYSVTTIVMINSEPEIIWKNIIRVKPIGSQEYTKGFFNYSGIPRPLFAELDKDTINAIRIGHFEEGLMFVEKVTSWDRNKHIGFDISVVPSSIRQTVFDQHVLRGNHFRFLNAHYSLKKIHDGQTELTLSSSYELNTNFNWYASYCGNKLLTDFQERLLQVIKTRCDK